MNTPLISPQFVITPPLLEPNPLLAPIQAPIDYAHLTPQHIPPAIEALLENAYQTVTHAADPTLPPTWEAIVEPLDTALEQLWRAWSVASHLNAVVNTPALREVYNALLPKISQFSTWIGLNEALYQQYQRLARTPEFAQWRPERRRIVELALRDFQLSGIALQGEARQRYAENVAREAQLSQKFSENVLDATDTWSLFIEDAQRLAGIPHDVLHTAQQAATAAGKTGWTLTLQMPCYLPVMQYAHDRALRATLYDAHSKLASELGDTRFDNSALIEELLALRAEKADLLGFKNFADLHLQTHMASHPEEVIHFLQDLAQRARTQADADLSQLKDYARTELELDPLEAWDIPYVSEQLRHARYDYSEKEVKQYFTEPRVLAGLFEVIETLFAVRLRPCTLPTWHEEVRTLSVENQDGAPLGYLYLDLYARTGKQSGAWVDSERSRRQVNDSLVLPVVTLTCNFSRPNDGRLALLTHSDLITLFHEMGHALHALLSEVTELGAAAFSNLEWDVIELPSQFMENFCWEWPVLQRVSAHINTGTPLPHSLYEKLVAARLFQSGMQMLRQIEFALFDMRLHTYPEKPSIDVVLTLLTSVREEIAVLHPPSWQRLPHSFSHLFAGGYGAGYYSYLWAEVLSADAYEAFEEATRQTGDHPEGTLDPATGARFRQEILAVGATRPAAESFAAFRGRAPRIDALLRHNGMATSTVNP